MATASFLRRNLTAAGYREGRQIHSRLPALDTGVVREQVINVERDLRGNAGNSTRRSLLNWTALPLHDFAPRSISDYRSLCTTPATATLLP